ncbi:TetR/AcrR family transcriptional regulator [Pseudactinotalea sp. HY158]|uniref:TetR/AcrR family transcriptional regulator n=1 Tax=Pseudactinotalea sp. HY158 TaxID=2654547 RepID=UPI001E3EBD20|nr:TetR/AcrR family transcriptional regulator [Pseudactinotalea sp. HY158]
MGPAVAGVSEVARRRLPPAQRRRQIVEAARTRIAAQGVARASLRDIAAAAGVSMGTVSYHFAGVDEILSAVVITEAREFYAAAVATADAEDDPWQALAALIDPMFDDSPAVLSHWRIWTHYWAAVARRPGIAGAHDSRIRHWEECCARVLARGVASGAFRTVDPAAAALKLAAYSDGLGAQWAQGVTSLTPVRARTWMHEFARALLAA